VGWEGVQELAQPGSQQEQTALERLMQIYYGEGDAGEANAVRIATELLSAFPKTGLKGLAEFAIGTSYFKQKHFVEAETWLLKSRASDPFYMLRATRGLVLGTFYRKQLHETESYLKEYESLPPPSDPAQVAGAKLPVELYLWLAEEERKEDRPEMAERNYKKVTELTTDPDYLGPTWRNLGKVQLAQKEYDSAVTSFLNFIKLVPNGQNDFETVIDLGEAQLNTKNFTAAKDQGLQALRLEPEGLQSARAQLLLADISMAQGNYVDAGKQYAAIAVLFNDDPNVPVEALKKAATAYQSAGDLSMTQKMEDQLAQWQATRKK
jgi:tetratricopeptide (TPR) repeat protein